MKVDVVVLLWLIGAERARKILLSREGRELQVNPRRSEGLSVFGAKGEFFENRLVGLRKGCRVEEELLVWRIGRTTGYENGREP